MGAAVFWMKAGVLMRALIRSASEVYPRLIALRLAALVLLAVCLPGTPFAASSSVSFLEQTQEYRTAWDAGEYRPALRLLDGFIRERGEPIPIRWLTDRAELRYETGQLDGAIADFEQLVARFPTPPTLLRLALLYRERGRQDDYRQMLQRAEERSLATTRYSVSPELVLVLGRIAELRGENPKVILNSLYGTLLQQAPQFAAGHIAAAELALRKWDYQLAAEHYEKALTIEENNQSALAGLAECYWRSNDPRVEACLERLRRINPHHSRARAIRIEIALDANQTDEALRLLEEALAINPNSPTMLALQAAACFLLDSPTSMALAQKRALALQPAASEVFRTPGRIASRHYRFQEAIALQKRALEIAPDDHEARALYAFDLLRVGEEAEGRQQLEKTFEADRYNVTVFNMLNLMDSLARFASVARGPFVLQMPKQELPLLAPEALALLTEAHDLYARKYEVKLETPIHVQIFDNHDDFMVRSVGLPGSVGHLGICFGRLVTMDSPSARTKWEANWQSVLWHEFVHVITLQKTKNRMPRWLSEGISVYEETQRDAAWGQRLNVQYKPIVQSEALPGLKALETYFTNPKSAAHLMFGYMAAGEFVRFYVDRFGQAALNATLDRIAAGEGALEALAGAARVDAATLDAEFQAQFKKRLAPFNHLPEVKAPRDAKAGLLDDGASVTLAQAEWAALPSAFTDAMREAREALEAEAWDRAETALKSAHDLFPDYMGADAPLRQLIDLYERRNRRADLLAALRREIEWNPTDFPSCRKLIDLLREDKAWPEVIRIAERAFAIDPFDVEMRRLALEACGQTADRAKALETLDRLVLLDSAHAIDYRLQRVEALSDLGRWPEARRAAVELLEETPNFWKAQEALLRIVERDSAALTGGR